MTTLLSFCVAIGVLIAMRTFWYSGWLSGHREGYATAARDYEDEVEKVRRECGELLAEMSREAEAERAQREILIPKCLRGNRG